MVSVLGSFLLVVVGTLSNVEEISKYRPSIRLWLEGLSPFRGYVGLGCTSYGVMLTLQTLIHIGSFFSDPFIYLSVLSAGIVSILCGLLLGYPLVADRIAAHLSEHQSQQLDAMHKNLLSSKSLLGYSALALGLFHVLLYIFPEAYSWGFSLWG